MKENKISYKMVPHLLGFIAILMVILGKNLDFWRIFSKIWNSSKYKFPHISYFFTIRELKLSQKLFKSMNNIVSKIRLIAFKTKKLQYSEVGTLT